jgi:hypothetical protein
MRDAGCDFQCAFSRGRDHGAWVWSILSRLTWELQIEALHQVRNAGRVHLQPVSLAELSEGVRIELCYSAASEQLAEELLKTGRRNQLNDTRRLITRVPEGVPLVTRFEYQVALLAENYFIAQQPTDSSFKKAQSRSRVRRARPKSFPSPCKACASKHA